MVLNTKRNSTKHQGMKQSLSSTAANYQDYIKSRGIEGKVVELPDSTRTAAEAAFAIGCEIAEIAKSVVFYVKDTHRPVLVIASGINRVDEKKLKKNHWWKTEKS